VTDDTQHADAGDDPHVDDGHADGSDCATAHGEAADDRPPAGTLVAVYAGPVAEVLLRWGRELGYRTVLFEPDPDRPSDAHRAAADEVVTTPATCTSMPPRTWSSPTTTATGSDP
jgi:hypothetical protein